MKRWAETWSSFPAAHKKRCYQGLAGYGLLLLAVTGWIAVRANDTAREWQSRIPSASAVIKTAYLTPQIIDTPKTPVDNTVATVVPPPVTGTSTPPPSGHDAGPPVVDDGKAYVVIIMSDMGLAALPTERAMKDLPPQVVLAFSPYAENLQDWIAKAAAARHEALMLMPMETDSYPQDDPGPRALSSRLSDHDNNDNLNWLLERGKGAVGVVNLMGSRFMTNEKRLAAVFETLRKNNSMFVETPGIEKSAGAAVAATTDLPYLAASAQIDAVAADKAIREQLAALEKRAHERGYAIGIAAPYPLTFNVIKSWAAGLEDRGVTLGTLKTVWKNKPHHEEAPAQQPPQTQPKQP